MRGRPRLLICASLFTVVSACVTTPGDQAQEECVDPGGDLSLDATITAAEVAEMNAATAYQVIERLRPDLLQWEQERERRGYAVRRGIGSALAVSINGGDPVHRDSLASIPAASIREMQWLDRCQAEEAFRPGYPKGVLRVVTN